MPRIVGGFPGLEPGQEIRLGDYVIRVTSIQLDVRQDYLDVTSFSSPTMERVAAGPQTATFTIEGVDLRRDPLPAPADPGPAPDAEPAGVGPARLVRWTPR